MTDNEIFDIWDSYKRILKIHKDNVGGTVERELVISQGVADGTYDLINRLKANEEKNENIIRLADKTIEKQQAEIERLQQKNSELESDLILKTYDYEHLLMKCKELQAISSSRKDRLMQTVVKLQTAKSEARKEIIEKIKSKFTHKGKSTKYGEFTWDDVTSYELDNLLKEIEGENPWNSIVDTVTTL